MISVCAMQDCEDLRIADELFQKEDRAAKDNLAV